MPTCYHDTHAIFVLSSSKLAGTKAPASSRALFFAAAVSLAWFAHAPAWPNCTSEVNMVAHVPTKTYKACVVKSKDNDRI